MQEARTLSPKEVRRDLTRLYRQYDETYKSNKPQLLFNYYQEILAPDSTYVNSSRVTSRARFLDSIERTIRTGRHFYSLIAVIQQQTILRSIVFSGTTAVLSVREITSHFQYDLDEPTTGPDGLSGNPQPQEGYTATRRQDTWEYIDKRWLLKQYQEMGGEYRASYLNAEEATEYHRLYNPRSQSPQKR
jgi:hypothetical protein